MTYILILKLLISFVFSVLFAPHEANVTKSFSIDRQIRNVNYWPDTRQMLKHPLLSAWQYQKGIDGMNHIMAGCYCWHTVFNIRSGKVKAWVEGVGKRHNKHRSPRIRTISRKLVKFYNKIFCQYNLLLSTPLNKIRSSPLCFLTTSKLNSCPFKTILRNKSLGLSLLCFYT